MDILIKDSLTHRTNLNLSNTMLYLNPTCYAREYKTVGIITSRQYGKSSYINEFCKKSTDRIVIVVQNYMVKKDREKLFTNNGNVEVYSFDDIIMNIMNDSFLRRGLRHSPKPAWVFLDEVQADESSLYKLLEHFNDTGNSLQTFIWMKT